MQEVGYFIISEEYAGLVLIAGIGFHLCRRVRYGGQRSLLLRLSGGVAARADRISRGGTCKRHPQGKHRLQFPRVLDNLPSAPLAYRQKA